MKEKDFQTLFNKWIKETNLPDLGFSGSMPFELKIEKGSSMRFDKVKDHQIEALYNSANNGFFYKIPDLPFIEQTYLDKKSGRFKKQRPFRFQKPRPFDCFYMREADSFVVILFYRPREKKRMIWIEISNFMSIKFRFEKEGRKSLKESEWMKYSDHIFDLEPEVVSESGSKKSI